MKYLLFGMIAHSISATSTFCQSYAVTVVWLLPRSWRKMDAVLWLFRTGKIP